jgi:hypothetical protein
VGRRSVFVRELRDELVILDTCSNRIHQLNRTAAFVWNETRNGVPPDAIPTRLVCEFEVESETPSLIQKEFSWI